MTASSSDADVVVIGGGMAGCMAAISAAQTDGSASVRLVTADESTLRAASGLVDVLGYTPDGEGPLRDPFAAIPDLPESHPYRTVGVEAVREGLAVFDDAVGDAYRGGHTDLNALVPTGGAPKPTARYPESVAAGLTARTDDMLLVGFDQLTAMDAHLMADQLQNMGVPFATMGVDVRFPVDVTDYPAAPRMAAALEADEPVTGTDFAGDEQPRSLRGALADAVYEYHGFQDRVGLPAVLGTSDHDAVRETIADRVSAEVFEIPLGPPSICGQRLGRLLFDAVEDHGVTVDVGTRVVDVAASDAGAAGGAQVEGVVLENGDGRESLETGAVVLATGGVAGAGIETDRDEVREPLFDCHVDAPDDREDWYADEFFGDHPFARFGVHPDEDLRPVDAAGTPEYDNLHAAGAVLDGYDFAAEKSGGGVSIATGYVAGRRALETD